MPGQCGHLIDPTDGPACRATAGYDSSKPDWSNVIAALREQSVQLPTQLQEPFEALCSALEPDQGDLDELVRADPEEDS